MNRGMDVGAQFIAPLHSFFLLLIFRFTRQCCLSSSQSCDRHPEWRATNVIQSHLVAERDTVGIATMFTTDTHFQERIRFSPVLKRHAYQLSYSITIECLEWINGENFHSLLRSRLFQP